MECKKNQEIGTRNCQWSNIILFKALVLSFIVANIVSVRLFAHSQMRLKDYADSNLAEVTESVDQGPNFNQNFESDRDRLVLEIMWKVLAREGKSKNYNDLDPLDGGTVGVSHFAVGGLQELYTFMNTRKYFKKSLEEMNKYYTSRCRPRGRRGNDTGWGCYSKTWWRNGMRRFLNSSESHDVQDRAFIYKMKPILNVAERKGWYSDRHLAIAIGIGNSVGIGGFIKIGREAGWIPEKALRRYVGRDPHRLRRLQAIDDNYPL